MMITLECEKPRAVGPNRTIWAGTVRFDGHVVRAQFDVTKSVTPQKALLNWPDLGRTRVEGAWDTFEKVLNHPGMNAAMTAVMMIPGAGQFAAPAMAAARGVAAIGKDISQQQILERAKKQKARPAAVLAQEINKSLGQARVPVRVAEKDVRLALIARQVAPKVSPEDLAKLGQKFTLGSPHHRSLLALRMAMGGLGRMPDVQFARPPAQQIWTSDNNQVADEDDEQLFEAA